MLGPPLRESTETLLAVAPGASAETILGSIDAIKVRSSMTLFHRAASEERLFKDALARFYANEPDPETDRLLRS